MSYIGNAPVIQSTEFREEYFPTASQTAFITGGFHPSAVSITRNGVLLSESDYVKGTDNVTITLNSAAISGDVVVIRGNRSLAQGVSVSESRVEYTWQSGDTVVQLNADVIPAYADIFLNGVKLASSDYSINASTKQVSFTSAPAVGDVIAVVHKNETSALVALPLKDSAGNNILSESGSVVSIGTLRLPTSGGIQDSSGANVLTEANGTVTLTADEANVGSNALVVDSSGYVGIGTSSPSRPLHVTRSDGTGTVVKVGNTGSTTSVIEFANTASTDTISIGAENNDLVLKSDDGDISLNATGDPATSSMTIKRGGKVGIGTNSPYSLLEIRGSSDGQNVLQLSNSAGSTGGDAENQIRVTCNGNLNWGNLDIQAYNTIFTQSGTERMRIDSSGNVKIGGNLRLTHIGGYPALVGNAGTGGIAINVNQPGIVPATTSGEQHNVQDLGRSGVRWNDAYVTNGVTSGSDANEKTDITTSELGLDFIKRVNPISYKWIGRYRTHYGMISQEIETLLSDIGKTSMDFAGLIKSPVTDDDGNETGEFTYGLRYSEFISPMIKAIQEQQTIIESQQSQIDALTARIEALEATP